MTHAAPNKKEQLLQLFNANHKHELEKILHKKFSNKFIVDNVANLVPSVQKDAVDQKMIKKEVNRYLYNIEWKSFELSVDINMTVGGPIVNFNPIFKEDN